MTTLPLDPYIAVSGEFRNPGSPGDRAYAPPPTMRSFAAAIRSEAALLYAPIGSAPVISVNGKTGVVVLNAADVGALTQTVADGLYAPIGHNHDAAYLKLTGGNLTGPLTISGSAVARSPDATNILEWRTNGFFVPPTDLSGYSPIGHNHDTRYLQLTGGNLTGPLTISGNTVGRSPDANNSLEWRANGFYVPPVGSGGGGSATVLRDEEFAPANAATTVTLASAPSDVHVVTRNGVAQSQAAGHYTIAGAVLTFSDAFVTGERVIVVYSIGVSSAVDVWTKQEADDRFVNVPGDTMTGTLLMAGVPASAHFAVRPTGATSSARFGSVTNGSRAEVASNLWFNGTAWFRDDTSKGGTYLSMDSTPYFAITQVQAGGVNPPTLLQRMVMNQAGATTFNCDDENYPLSVSSNRGRIRYNALSDSTYGRTGQEYPGAGMSMGNNLTTTTASGGWARDDTTKLGASLSVGSGTTILNLSYVAAGAGANPATPVNRMQMLPSGVLSVLPDAGVTSFLVGTSTVFSNWHSGARSIMIGTRTTLYDILTYSQWGNNNYNGDGADLSIANEAGSKMYQQAGSLTWANCPPVPAGSTQAMVVRMRIDGNGTMVLTPVAGNHALQWGGGAGALYNGGAIPYLLGQTGGYTMLGGGISGGNCISVAPATHNTTHLGWGDRGWALVHSVSGLVQDSLAEDKQNFIPLDPQECIEAVLNTDWLAFEYKEPEGRVWPMRTPEMTDAEWQAHIATQEQMDIDAALSRKQRGYALGSDEFRVHELFGMADRKSAGTQSDLATVACALQQALRDIAELKAKLAVA